jgi:hypothetical protein
VSSALADHPRLRSDVPDPGVSLARLLVHGAAVALWVCVVGFGVVAAPVLVAWLGSGATEPLGDALSVAAAGWLVGLGATLTTPDATWNLTPLGLTLVSLVLAYRGGVWAAESSRPTTGARVGALAAAVTVTAGGLGALTASVLTVAQVTIDPGEAGAQAALVTLTGAAVGMLAAEPDVRASLVSRLPDWVRGAAAPAAAAGATLLAGTAGVMTVALVGAFGTVSSLVEQISPGVAGVVTLLVLSLVYLPTLLLWTLAVLVGPGVDLGAQVSVTAQQVQVGPLPGFPLLGIVPETMPGWVRVLGPFVLLAAGVVTGALVARRGRVGQAWWQGPATAAVSGLAVAVAVSVLTWASSGAMGPGDLAWVGVSAGAAGLVAGGAVAAAGATTAALLGRRGYGSSRDRSASVSAS